jgi:hypothetical protein
MNDETVLNVASTKGPFSVSQDIWGSAFIMARDNQDCIALIDKLLEANSMFRREEVDFADYGTPPS